MSTVCWIHLSDLHLREAESWNSSLVLKSLIKDISTLPEYIGINANFAIISGDIAYSGKPKEYESACAFFDAFRKAARIDNIFVAPGNHDVDRSLITTQAVKLQKKIKNRDTTNQILLDLGNRSVLFERLKNYNSFVRSYFGNDFFNRVQSFQPVFFHLNNIKIAIFCLNTAWLSREQMEKGKLCLGEYQVKNVTDLAHNAVIRIGTVHHPLEWLREFDRKSVEPVVLNNADFLLHGHTHLLEFFKVTSPDYGVFIVGAGAAYESRLYRNTYNIICLDTETGLGTIWFRGYSDMGGGFWNPDTLVYKKAPTGSYHFDLSSRLKKTFLQPVEQTRKVSVELSKIYDAMYDRMTKDQIDNFIFHLRDKLNEVRALSHLYDDFDPGNLPNRKMDCLRFLLNTLSKSQPKQGIGAISVFLNLLKEMRQDVYEGIFGR